MKHLHALSRALSLSATILSLSCLWSPPLRSSNETKWPIHDVHTDLLCLGDRGESRMAKP